MLSSLWLSVWIAAAPIAPPWGKMTTPEEQKRLADTVVCKDARGHVLAMVPHERQLWQLFFGTEKSLGAVRLPPWNLTGTDFFDPRFIRPGSNPDFRGNDMRLYSEVNWDPEKQACSARCGERDIPLEHVAPEPARTLLLAATFEENPQAFEPHALLRDESGRYFLVQKGIRENNAKSFQLWVGLKGQMREQKMLNVVSDSEGEIFTTRNGELRLIVDPQASVWVSGKKRTPLRRVPVEQNLALIYSDLGVYGATRLGTPCDDL